MAIFILLLLTQIVNATILFQILHGSTVGTELLPKQVPPLHLLHQVLLKVKRIQEHHVLARTQVVSSHVHEVLAVVQDDALGLWQLLGLEVR